MKKKIILIVIFLIVLFIGFKYYGYMIYNDSKFEDLAIVKFNGNMIINHVDLNEDECIRYENFKVKNIFNDYEIINDQSKSLKYKKIGDENDAIFMGVDDQFVTLLKNDNDYKKVCLKLFKNNNINNDLDLLKYFESHSNDSVKFFMTYNKQKEISKIKEINSVILPSLEYVKSINGDYTGYIFKTSKNISEVNILKDDKRYYFTFIGNYDESFINDFMNSLTFDN